MPLISVKELLCHATENHYGVAAFNTLNFETVKWAVMAAEQERVPVIIQFYPGFAGYISMKQIATMAKEAARNANVPIAVHLDHSTDAETAVSGVRDGFPSVMVDGSSLPYEENIVMTREVVRTAKIFGVDVEAELGHVGSGERLEDFASSDMFTDPDQAVDFVCRTGCDSLAIAVGNAHGAYKQTPKLDFERIKTIRAKLSIPLVMHGCSDIPDEQMREAVRLGMSKFNIATEYFRAFYDELEKVVCSGGCKGNAVKLFHETEQSVIQFARSKIQLLNPNKFSM